MRTLRAQRIVAGAVALFAVVVAGVGWLYLLRDVGALAAGPRVPEALPLQRLAHADAQPLVRLLAAWLPAGLVAGAVLRALGAVERGPRVVIAGAFTVVVLHVTGALLDSITAGVSMGRHLADQPGRPATWVPALLVAAGAALIPAAPRAQAVPLAGAPVARRLDTGEAAAP